MTQTNDEILEETIPADVVKELGDAREMINRMMNKARLAERVSLVYEIESGCLSYIPRKMKTKREEEISSEGYVHGVKSALEVIKDSNPADIFDWNKIIKEARLATLDDCKTLFKESFIRKLEEAHLVWVAGSHMESLQGSKWYKDLKTKTFTELEALRNADDKK